MSRFLRHSVLRRVLRALFGRRADRLRFHKMCIRYRDNAPEEDVPFVVVLGAQTHGDRPSRTLRERLDLAAEYLEAHPAARVIVSGGQRCV